MGSHVKIRFQFTNSAGGIEVETVWAIKRGNGFEIDNIPFYISGFALGDVVAAEPDPAGGLLCSRPIRASGHSTIPFVREPGGCCASSG